MLLEHVKIKYIPGMSAVGNTPRVCKHLAYRKVGSPDDDASGHFHCPGTMILRKLAGGHLTPSMKERRAKCSRGKSVGYFKKTNEREKPFTKSLPRNLGYLRYFYKNDSVD